MKIIICGAGKVGTSIARHLVEQGSDVTVIDSSHKLIDDLREKCDNNTLETLNEFNSYLELLEKQLQINKV